MVQKLRIIEIEAYLSGVAPAPTKLFFFIKKLPNLREFISVLLFSFAFLSLMENILQEPSESPLGLKNTPEQRERLELQMEGIIPPWLNGTMYRAGI